MDRAPSRRLGAGGRGGATVLLTRLQTELGGYGSPEERQSALRRAYYNLAARAKHDPTTSIQFKESYLHINADPVEALAILREHPLIEPALEGSGRDESIGFRVLGKTFRATLKGLVARLAKLSIKEGGEEAARRLQRYLTAGANGTVPAYEITVIHGLVVKTRFNLGAGAYLAPYATPERSSGYLKGCLIVLAVCGNRSAPSSSVPWRRVTGSTRGLLEPVDLAQMASPLLPPAPAGTGVISAPAMLGYVG